ncbi:MAG: type I 3-dehydroquinate dehydratase, partial [Hydrogenothermus sp.]
MISLGEKPLIALPVEDKEFEKTVETAKEKGIDIIEL